LAAKRRVAAGKPCTQRKRGPLRLPDAGSADADAVLLAHTFHRLNQAEERIQDVDKLEQTWQTRIKAAGNELHSTERRLRLQRRDICQKKVAELLTRGSRPRRKTDVHDECFFACSDRPAVFIAASSAYAAEPACSPNRAVDYHFAWLQVTSAIGEISTATLISTPINQTQSGEVVAMQQIGSRRQPARCCCLPLPLWRILELHVTAPAARHRDRRRCARGVHVLRQGQCPDHNQLEWLDNSLCNAEGRAKRQPSSVENPPPAAD